MIVLTIAIALFGFLLALVLRPALGLVVYFAILFLYPQPLTLKLASFDLNTSRIVILGVLMNAMFRHKLLSKVEWSNIDFWVVTAFFAQSLALATNADPATVLINRGGNFLDVLLPYFAVRMIIHRRQDLITAIKGFALAAIPLALMGVFEAKTGRNPVGFMEKYYSFGLAGESGNPAYQRHGFYRATVTLGNYISFGMFFAGVAPLAMGLLKQRVWPKLVVLGVFGLIVLGLFSSMSSGPLFSIFVSICFICFFPYRRYWPALLVVCFVGLAFVEVFSNRPFYYVLTGFAFDQETAYYRIGLIEEAFGGGMSGHWLTGFGYVGLGPGNDNSNFHWEHMDLTSIYVFWLARTGLVGLLPFLIVNYLMYRKLYLAARLTPSPADVWTFWCVAAAMIGWNFAYWTVAAMGPIETLLYILMGVCASAPTLARAAAADFAQNEGTQPLAPPTRAPYDRFGRDARARRRQRRLEWNYHA